MHSSTALSCPSPHWEPLSLVSSNARLPSDPRERPKDRSLGGDRRRPCRLKRQAAAGTSTQKADRVSDRGIRTNAAARRPRGRPRTKLTCDPRMNIRVRRPRGCARRLHCRHGRRSGTGAKSRHHATVHERQSPRPNRKQSGGGVVLLASRPH